MDNDKRLVDIELKIAAQEDLLETLNRQVYEQAKKIDQLEALCTTLARQLKDVRASAGEGMPANERPPHY